jgi:CheY-like chemotaxis protein
MMPEMTGIELYGRLRAFSPGAADRIVFWTGGAFTQRARDFMAGVGNDCIQKPFTLRALQEIVNATLASASH